MILLIENTENFLIDLFNLTEEINKLDKEYLDFCKQPYYDGKANDECKLGFELLEKKEQLFKLSKKYFGI